MRFLGLDSALSGANEGKIYLPLGFITVAWGFVYCALGRQLKSCVVLTICISTLNGLLGALHIAPCLYFRCMRVGCCLHLLHPKVFIFEDLFDSESRI